MTPDFSNVKLKIHAKREIAGTLTMDFYTPTVPIRLLTVTLPLDEARDLADQIHDELEAAEAEALDDQAREKAEREAENSDHHHQ